MLGSAAGLGLVTAATRGGLIAADPRAACVGASLGWTDGMGSGAQAIEHEGRRAVHKLA